MSKLRISDAPLLPNVNGSEKIPTGGRGDYAISVGQIKDHIFQNIDKEIVGLGNVDNTSDLDKPVSTAQQVSLDLKADLVDGVVPENQIPSSFNDVLEFTTANLPIVGESGKIYVTTDTNRTWRWSGNQYVEISNGGVSDSTLKLQTPRKIANIAFDGTQNIDIPHNNLTSRNVENAHTAFSIGTDSGETQQYINDYNGVKWRNKAGGYALNARVMLENGDVVKSTVANNKVNPNVDMTGWYQAAPQSFGTPSKAVNIVKGITAPTVVDYFNGYFWGTSGNNIHRSVDGETWELFSSQSFTAARMIPTSDNEVLALATDAEKVYKSIGWSTGNPTWKLVLTNPYAGSANPMLRWGFDGYQNKFIVTHYGSGTPNYVNSRYVWISTDAGETFNIVYDTQAAYPGLSSESHVHAACYDRWTDRFYFSEGHGTPHGIYYSDDNGLNWTKIPNVTLNPAPTTMTPTDFGIVLGLDSEPNGTGLLPRSKVPDGNDIQLFGESLPTGKSSGVTGFADRAMRDPHTGIVYVAYNSSFADVPVVIFAVGSGGASIILREGFGDLSIKRFSNVVVAKGKLLATHNVVGRIKADIPPYTSQSVPFDTGNVMPEVKSTRLAALAVGRGAVATGLNSLAIGATVTQQDSVAIGFRGTVATGALSVVIGTTAKGDADSTVVGYAAESVAGGTSLGYSAKSTGAESTAVGRGAQSLGVYALTVGRGSKVEAAAAYGTAIGADSSAKGSYCLSVGYSASATTEASTAIGSRATAVGGYSTALGDQASSGFSSVSVGRLTVSSNYSVSLGHGAKTGVNSIAVGYSSEALQQYSVAIGDAAKALSSSDVVIGRAAKTIAGSAPQTVLGTSAESNAAGGVAIGNLAKVNAGHAYSVAIGSNSETQRTSSLSVGNRDIESTKNGGRLILKSPNGTTYAISVSDTGELTAVAI